MKPKRSCQYFHIFPHISTLPPFYIPSFHRMNNHTATIDDNCCFGHGSCGVSGIPFYICSHPTYISPFFEDQSSRLQSPPIWPSGPAPHLSTVAAVRLPPPITGGQFILKWIRHQRSWYYGQKCKTPLEEWWSVINSYKLQPWPKILNDFSSNEGLAEGAAFGPHTSSFGILGFLLKYRICLVNFGRSAAQRAKDKAFFYTGSCVETGRRIDTLPPGWRKACLSSCIIRFVNTLNRSR